MELPATLAAAAAFIGLTVLAGWRGGRAPDLLKGPRMIPWRLVMVTSAAVVLVLLVHLASLLGLHQTR
ncbi:MAG: hypothetical protein K9G59_16715 [Caulobacter sp.]|nr:hypothetical protein [Caulobacter sp.]